jgi:hypothetical protein
MRAFTRWGSVLLLTVVLAAGCGQGGGDLSQGDGPEVDEGEPGHGDMSDDLDGEDPGRAVVPM